MTTYHTIEYRRGVSVNYDTGIHPDRLDAAVKKYEKEGYSVRVLPSQEEFIEHILSEIKKKYPQAARNRGVDSVRFYKSINDRSKYVEVHYLSIANSINGGVIPLQVREYFNL